MSDSDVKQYVEGVKKLLALAKLFMSSNPKVMSIIVFVENIINNQAVIDVVVALAKFFTSNEPEVKKMLASLDEMLNQDGVSHMLKNA